MIRLFDSLARALTAHRQHARDHLLTATHFCDACGSVCTPACQRDALRTRQDRLSLRARI